MTNNAVDTKLMKALAHPLRQQLLIALSERVASPSELAEELGEPLGNVSYHVRMLVDLDCIELVSTTPRRGALEHHYRATVRPMLDDAQWAAMPLATRRALVGDVLTAIWRTVGDAADAGGFDDDKVHVSRERLALDARGYDEIADLLSATLERAVEIKAESADRLAQSGEPAIETWMAILHFRGADGGADPPPVSARTTSPRRAGARRPR